MSNVETLPVIDISPYLSEGNGEARRATSAALHAACVEYGFFYLDISRYVDLSEADELISLARRFFSSPQEEKDKIGLANQDGARGTVNFAVFCRSFESGSPAFLNDRICETQ